MDGKNRKTRNKKQRFVFLLSVCVGRKQKTLFRETLFRETNMFVSRNKCFAKQVFRETNVSACRVRCMFSVSRNKLRVTTNHHSRQGPMTYKMATSVEPWTHDREKSHPKFHHHSSFGSGDTQFTSLMG